DPANWNSTFVDEGAGDLYGSPPSLALTKDGRLHLAYWTPSGLRYATCSSSCTSLANWTMTDLVSSTSGRTTALALGPTGTLHLVYSEGPVRYAECPSDCVTAAAWRHATVYSTQVPVDYVALAVDSLDQPQMALTATGFVWYAW